MNDQMRALNRIGDVVVYNSNLWYRGEYEQNHPGRYYDFHLFQKKVPTLYRLPAYRWWELQSYRMGLKLPKPDIIHLHGAALRGKWALKLAKTWGVPLVITEHTGPWSSIAARPMLLRRVKWVMERADCVMPVSNHLAYEMAASGVVSRRMEVLANPVDTEFFTLRESPLGGEKCIRFVGRLDPFKGAMRTLQAFHAVADRLRGYELHITGDGKEAHDIAAYVSAQGLGDRVHLERGFFGREHLRSLYHRAAFLVYPSLFESFGLVGAEALSTGLPVLITNRTGPCDYFAAHCGLAIDPTDVEAMAQGMVHMAEHLHLYDPAAIRGHMHTHFGVERYANRLRALYQSVLSSG